MTTPSLSPEAVEAGELLAGLTPLEVDQYAGLTPLERVAAATHPHISMCRQGPTRMDCVTCAEELHAIRRYIPAVEGQLAEEHEREVLKEIAERDRNARWADRLADAIAAVTGVEIGEHSNLNDPWANALIALGLRDDAPAPRHAAPDDGIGDDGAPVAAALEGEVSGG